MRVFDDDDEDEDDGFPLDDEYEPTDRLGSTIAVGRRATEVKQSKGEIRSRSRSSR